MSFLTVSLLGTFEGLVLFLVGQYNNSSDIFPTFLLPLLTDAAGALVGFSLTDDCLKPSTDGSRVVAALLLAATYWAAVSLPLTAFIGASTCTGVIKLSLILSLTEEQGTGAGTFFFFFFWLSSLGFPGRMGLGAANME